MIGASDILMLLIGELEILMLLIGAWDILVFWIGAWDILVLWIGAWDILVEGNLVVHTDTGKTGKPFTRSRKNMAFNNLYLME